MSDARHITKALRGYWHGRYGLCFCPAHANTRTPSLSVSDGKGGRLLLRCHAGCSFLEILDAMKGLGLVEGQGHHAPPRPAVQAQYEAEQRREDDKRERQAKRVWDETIPIHGTIAETYLRSRGITCDLPETLGFHPECWHPTGVRLPAMVAGVNSGARTAIHRTYLRPDGMGKAEVEPAKAMLGATAGGAVWLSGEGDRLVVCEGIETGLSLASGLLRGPANIWAALSTSGMKSVQISHKAGSLVVATDGDEPGRAAGHALASRAAALGWTVSLLAAPEGQDWNDVLRLERNAA